MGKRFERAARWSAVAATALALSLAPMATSAQQMDDVATRVEQCMEQIIYEPAVYGMDWSYALDVAYCAGVSVEVVVTMAGDSFCYLGMDYFC